MRVGSSLEIASKDDEEVVNYVLPVYEETGVKATSKGIIRDIGADPVLSASFSNV